MDDEEDINKQLHFQVTDCKGNLITCTEVHWQDHIVGSARNRTRRHAEFDGSEEVIYEALKNPIMGVRFFSNQDGCENSRIYYGEGVITRYVKVIVDFKNDAGMGPGDFVTAVSVNVRPPDEKAELQK